MITLKKPVFEMPSPGTTVGRIFRILDLGSQASSYQGKPKAPTPSLFLEIELPLHIHRLGERAGGPMTVHRRFTASCGKKATLRKFLESARAKDFASDDEMIEWFKEKFYLMVGYPFTVSLKTSDDGEYTNLDSISPVIPGTVVPPGHYSPEFFTMDFKFWNPSSSQIAAYTPQEAAFFKKYGAQAAMYKKLPDRHRATIANSPEYKAVSSGIDPSAQGDSQPDAPDAGPEPTDDDVPF